MRDLLAAVSMLVASGALCAGATLYGYTGQSVTSGQDNSFIIDQNDICNSTSGSGVAGCTGIEGGTGSNGSPSGSNFGGYVLSGQSGSLLSSPNTIADDGYDTFAALGGGTTEWLGPQANQVITPGAGGSAGGVIVSSGTSCCVGTTTYAYTFDLSAFDVGGTSQLTVLFEADDLLDVYLNGTAPTDSTSPGNCSTAANRVYCGNTSKTYYSVAGGTNTGAVNVNTLLHTGVNVIYFVVDNAGGGPTGLDASFQLTDVTPAAVPEPGTFGVIGLGLLLAGVIRRRK